MEKAIGRYIMIERNILEVIEGDCSDCWFSDKECEKYRSIIGECNSSDRDDDIDVCFKEV